MHNPRALGTLAALGGAAGADPTVVGRGSTSPGPSGSAFPPPASPYAESYLKFLLLQSLVQHPTGAGDRGQSHTYMHTHIYIYMYRCVSIKNVFSLARESKGTAARRSRPQRSRPGVAAGARSQPTTQPAAQSLVPLCKEHQSPAVCSGGAGTLLRCQTGSHWGDAGVRGDGQGVVVAGAARISSVVGRAWPTLAGSCREPCVEGE